VVNETSIRALARAAAGSAAAGSTDFGALGERWVEKGTLTAAEFKKLSSLGAASRKLYKELSSTWWEHQNANNFEGCREVDGRIAPEGAFLAVQQAFDNQLRLATGIATTAAIAGVSFGPVGTLGAYVAWNTGMKTQDIEELVGTLKGLQSGDSRMLHEDNQVEQVHREELWRAKHRLLDHAIANGPMELDIQYYELTSDELIGKAARAAELGNKLRINVDAGRLSYPDKDEEKNQTFSVDDFPDKMRAILQLTAVPGDVGVSIFPALKELGDATNLMHRKMMRAGDRALLPGMNGNDGSGENVDAGYLLQGPVVSGLTRNFRRDVQASLRATQAEIWGDTQRQLFDTGILTMGPRGVAALCDAVNGPSPAGTKLAPIESYEDYVSVTRRSGLDPDRLFQATADELRQAMARQAELPLTDYGKGQLRSVMDRAVEATLGERNIQRLGDITPPEPKAAGTTRVALADLPDEREAMLIKAISEAEQFLYVPGFVITRPVAAAIVARRDELAARGVQLDIKIVADSGVYPGGSTPNSWGVKYLEDHGIQPRWSRLVRAGKHDRKIHAKQLITDKGEMFGSTNFSKKGLRDNWEHSGFVAFEADDPNRKASVGQFMQLWEHETFELNTKELAARWMQNRPAPAREWLVEDSRDRAIKLIIGTLERFEEQSGDWMLAQLEDPAVAARVQALEKTGMAHGYAVLKAVEQHMGTEAYWAELDKLPANQDLELLKAGDPHYSDLDRWNPEVEQRLESFLADVRAGKIEHPTAVFDFDGTLCKRDIGERFLQWLIDEQKIQGSYSDYEEAVKRDPAEGYALAVKMMKGVAEESLKAWAAPFAAEHVQANVFPKQRELVSQLQEAGVDVWIVSASNRWVVEAAAPLLGIDPEQAVGISAVVRDGKLTDEIEGPVTYREGKVEAIRKT
ncbi:MAG: HAD-IB family phosphatase, partial [Candidatus Eremiobacterota bacterium]